MGRLLFIVLLVAGCMASLVYLGGSAIGGMFGWQAAQAIGPEQALSHGSTMPRNHSERSTSLVGQSPRSPAR